MKRRLWGLHLAVTGAGEEPMKRTKRGSCSSLAISASKWRPSTSHSRRSMSCAVRRSSHDRPFARDRSAALASWAHQAIDLGDALRAAARRSLNGVGGKRLPMTKLRRGWTPLPNAPTPAVSAGRFFIVWRLCHRRAERGITGDDSLSFALTRCKRFADFLL
jgi:hypothetical protein